MSREIKFRAWDGKQMLTEENFGFVVSDYDSIIKLDEYGWTEHGVDCVEQYTGLTDKNGKEIYENDIIKDTSDGDCLINAVFWCEKGGFWGVKPRSPFAERDWGWFIGRDNIEVIGNVHENKELLGGEE